MCVLFWGNHEKSTTEFIEKLDNYIVVIENIPCEKCVQCGEAYFSDTVAQNIENILSQIQRISSELTVTVIDYANKVA